MTDETEDKAMSLLLALDAMTPVSASVAAHAIKGAPTDDEVRYLPVITDALTKRVRSLSASEYRAGSELLHRRSVAVDANERAAQASETGRMFEDWRKRREERGEPLADRVDWTATPEEIEASVDAVAEEVYAKFARRGHLTVVRDEP